MKVYVVRHGESETNLQKRWTGWFDAQLTQKGREDAEKAGEFLKNISFDKVFSSDLSRAVETKEIALPGCDFEKTPLIREVNIGSLERIEYALIPFEKRVELSKVGYAEFGGETREEFVCRIDDFLKELEGEKCENIAVFCHGGVLCTMLDIVMGIQMPRRHYVCNNCTVAVFEFKDDVWKLYSWVNLT